MLTIAAVGDIAQVDFVGAEGNLTDAWKTWSIGTKTTMRRNARSHSFRLAFGEVANLVSASKQCIDTRQVSLSTHATETALSLNCKIRTAVGSMFAPCPCPSNLISRIRIMNNTKSVIHVLLERRSRLEMT